MAIKFKRGGDFYLKVEYQPTPQEPPNLIGFTVTSQLLDSNGVRHDLTTEVSLDGMFVELFASPASTETWCKGEAQLDLRYTNGTVFYTDTLAFPIIHQITLT